MNAMSETSLPGRIKAGTCGCGSLGSEVRLRRMGLADLAFVVSTHLDHFPDGFFAQLGPRFLARHYRTYLDGPTATALIAEVEGEAVGFLVGVLDTRLHRHLLLRYHGIGLLAAAVAGMARHPGTGLKFITGRSAKYARKLMRRSSHLGSTRGELRTAVLAHVVVVRSARCRGIGSSLLESFLVDASRAGCEEACLVTSSAADGAGGWYANRGWERDGMPAHADGRSLLRFQKTLTT